MSTATLDLPSSPPIHGWENLTETNAAELDQKNTLCEQWHCVHVPYSTNLPGQWTKHIPGIGTRVYALGIWLCEHYFNK